MRAVRVRIHGLAEQHHLGKSLRDNLCGLTDDVRELAAPLGPARVRHNAVRAAVVAAALHGDPRFHPFKTARLKILIVLFEIEIGRREALAFARALEQMRQRAICVGPDHERHPRVRFEQLRPEPLRHAAGHAEDRVLFHEAAQLAKPADNALFGVVADRARVHEDDVRAFRPVDTLVANGRELSEHQLGIAHVHLAAVSLDVNCRHGDGRSKMEGRINSRTRSIVRRNQSRGCRQIVIAAPSKHPQARQ